MRVIFAKVNIIIIYVIYIKSTSDFKYLKIIIPDPPDPPHAARAMTTMRNFVRRPSRRFTSITPFVRNSHK